MSGGTHDFMAECELTKYREELAHCEKIFLVEPAKRALSNLYDAYDKVILHLDTYNGQPVIEFKKYYQKNFDDDEAKPGVEALAHYFNHVERGEHLSDLADLLLMAEGVGIEKPIGAYEKREKLEELKRQFTVADNETLQGKLSVTILEKILNKHSLDSKPPFVRTS